MKDLILNIYDDEGNVIYRQVMFEITDEEIDDHARKLVRFFQANDYATFDYCKG